ncbi:MAG: hypothetical protein AAF744_01095 [Pseudomonadota bacterium]
MRKAIFTSALALVISSTWAQAQSFTAINRLTVVPLNAHDFEVIEQRGEGARGIWCAAAQFALERGKATNAAEIYVKRPRGAAVSAAGRRGVVFTTKPAGFTPFSSYSVSIRQKGMALPAGHAVQFCKDYLIELEDSILFRKRY